VFVPFRARAPIPQQVPLRQFLIAMAVNHARHHVRARSGGGGARAPPRAHRCDGGDTGAHRREPPALSTRAVAALDRLAARPARGVRAVRVEERSSGEAARIVGTSDGNVRARLHHARRALRQRWRPGGKKETDMSGERIRRRGWPARPAA